jgi:hypothetical protein
MKSRKIAKLEHVTGTGEKRNAYKILVEKAEGKKPLVRSSCRY